MLAKNLGMSRPTLYDMLKKMRGKGVIAQTMKEGIRIFQVEPPSRLDQAFRKRLRDLNDWHAHFLRLMPDLERRQGKSLLNPKFQIFDGPDSVRHILMDMLLYRDIETWACWPIRAAMDILSPDFFRFHNTERIRNRIQVYAFWPPKQSVSVKRYPFMGAGPGFYREIRLAPPDMDFSMGYWIYCDKVAFLSSRRECFGFVVESAELATLLKAQHQAIWKVSQPLVINPADVQPFLASLR